MSNEVTDEVRTLGNETIIEPSKAQADKDRKMTMAEGVQEDNLEGVIFEEQTTSISVPGRNVPYVGNLEEREWNMKNFFLIPVRIQSGVWKTTQAVETVLANFGNETLWKSFSRWKSVIEQYTYYRYRVRYRIEVNGTQFHAGKLIASTRMTSATIGINSALAVQHVTLDAAENTVAELETDWGSCWDHLSTEQNFKISNMVLHVYNPLRTGTGASTEINYTVYAQLLDVQLSLPRPLQGSAQGLININNVTNMGNAPVEVKGDAFDVHGLDMPSNVEDPTRMVRSTISNPWMVEGRPALDRISMYPSGVSMASAYTFGNTKDEMDIDWLKRKWSRLGVYKVSTTDTFGTLITSGAVAPIKKITGNTNIEFSTGTLAWLASMFANWRGDLEFCVEVVSTNYHTGKLFFGVNYSTFPVVNFSSTGVDPTTYYGKVIELNEKTKCHNIVVPYSHWNSWCDTAPNGAAWTGSVPTVNNNTMQPPGFVENRFTAGEWFLTILNPLVVPSGVDTTIEVNILVRGGENFEFHRPGCSGLTGTGIAQGGDTIGNKEMQTTTKTPSQFIERPRSLRELLKRSVIADVRRLSTRVVGSQSPATNLGFGLSIINLDSFFDFNPWFNVVGAYAGMYGDLRLKIVVDFHGSSANLARVMHVGLVNRPGAYIDGLKTNMAGVVNEQLTTYTNNTVSGISQLGYVNMIYSLVSGPTLNGNDTYVVTNGFDTLHTINQVAPTLELEVPYFGMYKYKASQALTQHQKSISAWGHLIFYQPGINTVTATDTAATITTYLSCGDSFQTGHFIGPVRQGTNAQTSGGNYYYLGATGVVPTTATRDEVDRWEAI